MVAYLQTGFAIERTTETNDHSIHNSTIQSY